MFIFLDVRLSATDHLTSRQCICRKIRYQPPIIKQPTVSNKLLAILRQITVKIDDGK
jgi:hypothetical protein